LLANEADANRGESLQMLAISRLKPGKYQPRTHMDEDSLAQLAESIKAQGIIQPILARRLVDGSHEIIAGERRWRAARLAGLNDVPVLVREVADEAALAMSLIENIQRENLNPLEEAAGIQRLIDEFSMTHQTAADAVGRSRSAVTNLLRLLNLAAPVQEMLMQNLLNMGHARAMLGLSAAKQSEVAHQVADKQLSVRDTERLVQRDEDRHLEQEGETTTKWVDLVLLVELHHFFVELLLVVLVFRLKLLDLRLHALHGDHRLRLFRRQRKQGEPHGDGQQNDRHAGVRNHGVEERED